MATKFNFIDCGAHKGQSIKLYQGYDIHSFEPNPVLWPYLEKLPTKLYKKAVWIKDGEVDFYEAQRSQGSTLLKGKKTGKIDYDNPIKVRCIDLGKWIKETFDKKNHIVLKLNVEGAEYEILEHMIKDDSISWVNELYVEFHSDKLHGNYKVKEEELRSKLDIKDWKL